MQQDVMQEFRQLLDEQKKATAYLQKLAGQMLTYEQQQRKQRQTQWHRLEQHVEALNDSARSVSGSTQQLIRATVDGIKGHARDAIGEAMVTQSVRVQDVIDEFTGKVRWAQQALSEQRMLLTKAQTSVVWIGSAGLLVGMILAMAGTWGHFRYQRDALGELRQAHVEADKVAAINAADMLVCDGRLCVTVDRTRKHTVEGRTYHQVRLREQSQQQSMR